MAANAFSMSFVLVWLETCGGLWKQTQHKAAAVNSRINTVVMLEDLSFFPLFSRTRCRQIQVLVDFSSPFLLIGYPRSHLHTWQSSLKFVVCTPGIVCSCVCVHMCVIVCVFVCVKRS